MATVKIPPKLHAEILSRALDEGSSFRLVAEWLRYAHGVQVTGEAVRRLVHRLEKAPRPVPVVDEPDDPAEPTEPMDPATQVARISRAAWSELCRARRLVRANPLEWRRLHSALTLNLRVAQAQMRPAPDPAGPGPQVELPQGAASILPSFGLGGAAQKPEA